MEQKKLFPTVPFGFDKKAVIEYIETLNQAYEKEIQKLKEEQGIDKMHRPQKGKQV